MATKTFIRSTTLLKTGYYDLNTTAGAGATTAVVNTAASGTNIQWTVSAGGAAMAWISQRLSAGITLTTSDCSIWAYSSSNSANAGARSKLYRYTAFAESDTLGGPFDDGVEFTKTTSTEMTWAADINDVAFSAGDRIVLKLFITNVGVMGGVYTCTMDYNAADAATGDSFLNFASQTPAFVAETTVSKKNGLAVASIKNANGLYFEAVKNCVGLA